MHEADGRVRGAVCIIEDTTEANAVHRQLEHARRMESVGQNGPAAWPDFNNLLAL